MNTKKVTTIFLLIVVVGLIVGTFFLSQQTQQEQVVEDVAAGGCNTCFGSSNPNCDWERGYYNGCTTKSKSGSITRNNKPDVDNKGVVQAGDQGRSKDSSGKKLKAGQSNKRSADAAPVETVVGKAHGVYTVVFQDGSKQVIDPADLAGGAAAAKAAAETASTYQSRAAYQTATAPATRTGTGTFNPRYKGSYFKVVSSCSAGYNPTSAARDGTASCGGNIYGGTLQKTGGLCCAQSTVAVCNDGSYKNTMEECQCTGNANTILCAAFLPSAGVNINIVNDCSSVTSGSGQRSGCDGSGFQDICDGNGGSSRQKTDYCLATDFPNTIGNIDPTGTCSNSDSISNGEGGNFLGCTSGGQACVCRGGQTVCFEDTPDAFGQADSCPQTTTTTALAVPDSPQAGYVAFATGTTGTSTTGTSTSTTGTSTTTTTGTNTNTTGTSTTTTTTTTQVTESCVYLNQISPTPGVDFPPGQDFVYEAQYTCNGLNNNLAITVLDDTQTAVGSPIIASQSGQNYDSGTDTCTYTFNWAADGVTDGDFDVRLLLDGTAGSEVTSPVACTEQLSILTGAVEQPAFSIIKSGSHICSDTGSTLSYSVTVRNIGNVSAQLDFVEDTLPSGIDGTNTSQVTNISPAPSQRTANTLRWTVNQTLAANETRSYSYSIVLNAAQVASYGNSTLRNSVVAQYGPNDSTVQFENSLTMSCLPDTGIFDENPVLLLGLLLIITGIVVNRSGLAFNILGANSATKDGTSEFMSKIIGEDLGAKFMSYEDKILRNTEKKQKKN